MHAMPEPTRSRSWRGVDVKFLVYALVAIIVLLQYPLWLGNGSVLNLWRLEREIASQKQENAKLKERNAALEAEVVDLKTGLEAVEERARAELGMVKKDEAFYQIVPAPDKTPPAQTPKVSPHNATPPNVTPPPARAQMTGQ